MKHETYSCEQLMVYALAMVIALMLAFAPQPARSGGYSTDHAANAGPRWSNDHHHTDGLIVRPDCVALPPGADATYVPGRDAYGRPVIPAEPPKGFADSFPVGVGIDVDLGSKFVGGKKIDLYAGQFAFDPATNELSLNGRPWQRDCHP